MGDCQGNELPNFCTKNDASNRLLTMPYRRQRMRDPLHNLIEFRANDFENVMWSVIQSRPFQRLRRIKQLGFSEFVYPGATHTRFAHSVGVFHTARMLMRLVEEHLGSTAYDTYKARVALAAALVHDVGHGPFSHAFEEVGRSLSLPMARHEYVSELLIRDHDISRSLKPLGSGFAADVGTLIGAGGGPRDIYNAVVSSQFDADRLDYIRRDRLMTGTEHAAIDFDWLLSNLEVGSVASGVDEEQVGTLDTFVLGPKASYAAESYVLGLFQLYPTVYFHKATRGAEKVFSALLHRLIVLVRNNEHTRTGLSQTHPLIAFAKAESSGADLKYVLDLDDSVVWGGLAEMCQAKDFVISVLAMRLRDRRLYKCIDVREQIAARLQDDCPVLQAEANVDQAAERQLAKLRAEIAKRMRVDNACAVAEQAISARLQDQDLDHPPSLLVDKAERDPYKQFEESKGPLNQIMIRGADQKLVDVADTSEVIAAVKAFKLYRVYWEGDQKAKPQIVMDAIEEGVAHAKQA